MGDVGGGAAQEGSREARVTLRHTRHGQARPALQVSRCTPLHHRTCNRRDLLRSNSVRGTAEAGGGLGQFDPVPAEVLRGCEP